MATERETKLLEPTDQAILGMVSELPGRNASEPEDSFEIAEPWRLSPSLSDESSTENGNLTDTVFSAPAEW